MLKKGGLVFFLKVFGIVFLIALPFVFSVFYNVLITPKPVVRLSGGPDGGRYQELMNALANDLRKTGEFNKVIVVPSTGTYENLQLLDEGKVDFALYQSGSDAETDLEEKHDLIAFVSNLYPEVAHVMIRAALTDEQIRNGNFGRLAIGAKSTGDFRLGNALVEHLELDTTTTPISEMNYREMDKAFRNAELDTAVLSVGLGSEIVEGLISDGTCRLIDFPLKNAFLRKHIAYSSRSIPVGTYSSARQSLPLADTDSVAVNAQLITRADLSSSTVTAVLKTAFNVNFLKRNRLIDLYQAGTEYALKKPEFAIHSGAERFFDPRIQPLINPDFVEATEGIRSFVFSGLIGLFVLGRWLRYRSERQQAHQLDEYIVRLLEIEEEQMNLDRNYQEAELQTLENHLDEITRLRRNALEEFTAHQLKDDPAIECFISMSHALSEKINSKLTRDAIRKLTPPDETSDQVSAD